jgi:hypothetical protein
VGAFDGRIVVLKVQVLSIVELGPVRSGNVSGAGREREGGGWTHRAHQLICSSIFHRTKSLMVLRIVRILGELRLVSAKLVGYLHKLDLNFQPSDYLKGLSAEPNWRMAPIHTWSR